jgi:hypothetical protein
MKTLIEAHSDRILGFMAMQAGLPNTVLRDTMFAHPTMTEGLKAVFMGVPQLLEKYAEQSRYV